MSTTHNPQFLIRFDEGITLETSAFESIYSGQFTDIVNPINKNKLSYFGTDLCQLCRLVWSHFDFHRADCHQEASRGQLFGASFLCGPFECGPHDGSDPCIGLFPECHMRALARVVPFGAWLMWSW